MNIGGVRERKKNVGWVRQLETKERTRRVRKRVMGERAKKGKCTEAAESEEVGPKEKRGGARLKH